MANGKPDLSGLWLPDGNGYSGNLIQDVKDEAIFRPEAAALYLKRIANFSRDSPHSCPRQIFGTGGPDHSLYRILQSPTSSGYFRRRWLPAGLSRSSCIYGVSGRLSFSS
jgi:hypothetical protein